MLAYTWPLLSLFWTFLMFAGIFLLLFFVIWCFVDNFRRRDHHGLAKAGWTDVVLVERARVTSGSTFHSAGLVGQLRGSLSLTRMMVNSVDLYRNLKAETGLETGWPGPGTSPICA